MATLDLKRIQQIAINVRDLSRAVAFYRDTLGLRLLFQVPPQMAFFECGGLRLMLSIASAPQYDHAASILYYQVDDIDGVYQRLASAGVTFSAKPHLVARMPDHELHMAFFEDTEGNTLALSSEKR